MTNAPTKDELARAMDDFERLATEYSDLVEAGNYNQASRVVVKQTVVLGVLMRDDHYAELLVADVVMLLHCWRLIVTDGGPKGEARETLLALAGATDQLEAAVNTYLRKRGYQ